MAKVNELTYDVREAVNAFTDDSELDDRYIMYLYNIKRSKYLRQELNNYQRVPDNSILQTLCMEVIEVSSDECGVSFPCETIMRTKHPIPTPLELHTKVALTNVKSTDRLSAPFNFINKFKAPYISGSRFSNSIYMYLDSDNHLYIFSTNDTYKLLECISITGIFENPLELHNFSNCCGCTDVQPCFDEATSEYPLPSHLIDLIRQEIIQELLQLTQVKEDTENDDTDIINNPQNAR